MRAPVRYCIDCSHLLKQAPSSDPHLCAACALTRLSLDIRRRKALPEDQKVAVMILCSPPGSAGTYRIVSLSEVPSCSEQRMLHHSLRALRWKALIPMLEAIPCDYAVETDLPANDQGLAVLRELDCFDARVTGTLFGPVLITGPAGRSLLPAEVDRIVALLGKSPRQE
jgi:hypothetical protein